MTPEKSEKDYIKSIEERVAVLEDKVSLSLILGFFAGMGIVGLLLTSRK